MLRLYNSLTRRKDLFRPRKDKLVTMYVCGPTVYGPSHLGHARTYLAFDFIVRALKFLGYKVKLVSNITDVHDDIVKEANAKRTPIAKLAATYEREYFKDLKDLSIEKAFKYPKVTTHTKEIIAMVNILLKKHFAYRTDDGSVYFDVSKFKSYGRLSGRRLSKAVTGTRINTDKYERDEAADFALWKSAKKGEVGWGSPFGFGRPGWHIECSAMATKYLGDQLDIHGGGPDLRFPHHENEIAQSEAATGVSPFVRYWMHTGALSIDGRKMSRSLGNFITIRDALKKYPADVFRFFFLATSWRSPIDWNERAVKSAQEGLERIHEFEQKLGQVAQEGNRDAKVKKWVSQFTQNLAECLSDDFNSPKVLAELFGLIKRVNPLLDKHALSEQDAKLILGALAKWHSVFGLPKPKKSAVPKNVRELVTERERYRKRKEWAKADETRKKIAMLGWQVEDTSSGPAVKKA